MNKQRINIVIDLLICISVIVAVYSHTINRQWIFYDENVIYEETAVPIAASFSEIAEIIKEFGTSYSFTSGNFLHSSNIVYRKINLGAPYLLLLAFLLKKSAILWHLINLFFHLVNVIIVYLILNNCILKNSFSKRILTIAFTLIWALHPVQVESVLLSSNIGATVCYSICLLLFYDFIKQKHRAYSASKSLLVFFIFIITAIMLHEYIIVLPLIFLLYSLFNHYLGNDFKHSFIKSIKEVFPLLLGLVTYLAFLLLTSNHDFNQQGLSNPLLLSLERIFWLSPQIIFRYLKLIFFPQTLSIDQSGYVKLADSIFSPYSILCFSLLMLLLFIPLIIFFKTRKLYFLVLIAWLTFISLLPFSQILSPTYCLAAERYLYMPLFFIVFGAINLISKVNFKKTTIPVSILLLIITTFLGTRTYLRTNDWQNNQTLLWSLINKSPNYLYKGFRFNDLYNLEKEPEKQKQFLELSANYYDLYIKETSEKFTTTKNEPEILKSYGLDRNSLLIKAVYLKNYLQFTTNEELYKECLKELEPFLQNKGRLDAKILELYANLLIKNGDLASGKDIFLYAHKKYPTSPFILVSLIRFERDIEKNLPVAKLYLDKARALYPYSKDILFETLRYYQASNDLKEYSRHAYLYGLRTHSVFTYHEALAGFLMIKDLNSAKKTLDKLLVIDNNDPRTHYLASGYFLQKEDYFSAKKELDKALLLAKDSHTDKDFLSKINNSIANLNNLLGNH